MEPLPELLPLSEDLFQEARRCYELFDRLHWVFDPNNPLRYACDAIVSIEDDKDCARRLLQLAETLELLAQDVLSIRESITPAPMSMDPRNS